MHIDLKCSFCKKVFSHDISFKNYEIEKCPYCGTIIGFNDNFVIKSTVKSFYNNTLRSECIEICGIYFD